MRRLELDKKPSMSGCAEFAARVKQASRRKQAVRKYLRRLWNEGLYETAFRLLLVSRAAVALSLDDVSSGALRAVAGAVKRRLAVSSSPRLQHDLAALVGSAGEHFMSELHLFEGQHRADLGR